MLTAPLRLLTALLAPLRLLSMLTAPLRLSTALFAPSLLLTSLLAPLTMPACAKSSKSCAASPIASSSGTLASPWSSPCGIQLPNSPSSYSSCCGIGSSTGAANWSITAFDATAL